MTGSLCNKIARTLRDYQMVEAGDTIVTAVSGGPDSVCLLSCLSTLAAKLRISLVVAHFDHGLRPEEDGVETAFTRRLAESLNIPFISNPSPPEIPQKGSEEERARTARYEFLEKVRRQTGAHRVALGHTMDDQAETVLMRLLRGSGASGLAAIPPVRGKFIIRPMIRVTRVEVLAYLDSLGLDYMIDSSNAGNRYLRNRIRSELMPLLSKYQPRLVERLANTADIIREDDECLELLANSWIRGHAFFGSVSPQIPIPEWKLLHRALRIRVLRQIIDCSGTLRRINTKHLKAIEKLAEGPSPQVTVSLPGGRAAVRSYDRLFVTRDSLENLPFRRELDGPGTFVFPDLGWEISVVVNPKPDHPPEGPDQADFDMDLVSFPLILRSFKPGDRFIPIGMKGRKKVKDFFIDNKVTSQQRAATPILTCRGRIVWICGLRADDRFKVKGSTTRKLRVSINRLHPRKE
jgi:tRNA(Ile)-lysidine synthase